EIFKVGTSGTPAGATVGDFNGDGVPDFAMASNGGSVSGGEVLIFHGNGNGTFSPGAVIDLQSQEVSSLPVESVVTGDFDNDGKLDLEVTVTDKVFFLKGNGDGSFQYPQDAGTKSAATAAVVGDFNRDGKLDLAIAEAGSSLINVLLGDGDRKSVV